MLGMTEAPDGRAFRMRDTDTQSLSVGTYPNPMPA
jgi:hypothetical protein